MNKLFFIVSFFFSLQLFSQKEANIWYFGQNAGIDFSTSPPTALTNGRLSTNEGCSSFSSPSGELLFYSDGIEVFNKRHELMPYSDGRLAIDLSGNPSSTQSSMIIPKPGSTTIYYLFTVGTSFVSRSGSPNPGFNYYTVDMSKNSGLGEIVDGPINLAIEPDTGRILSQFWSEKVAAVNGKECNIFWVISFVEDTFYSYKITEDGVDIDNVVTSPVNYSTQEKRGYLKISPDGSKIAFADYNGLGTNANGTLLLFDFDNETGKISENSSQILIPNRTGEGPYGVAFSQRSNKLYASSFNGNFSIYQFDLKSDDIASSRTEIIRKSGFRGALQLGPDGKIYASIPNSLYLDVIENPNDNAKDVIYNEDAIYLDGKSTSEGLPPFISSLLLPINVLEADTNISINNQNVKLCTGINKTIITEAIEGNNISYSWTFDNGTGFVEISDKAVLNLTNLQLSDTGEYALEVKLIDECDNTTQYNASFSISVFEASQVTKPEDIFFCDVDRDGFNQFNLKDLKDDEILNGLDTNIFEVVYFDNVDDANSGDNPLPNLYTNPKEFSSQTIYARVQNKNAPNTCFSLTNFILAVNDLPIPEQPTPYRICDNLESGSNKDGVVNTFLLHTKDDEIYGTLNKSQYNITYHTSKIGAITKNVATIIDKNSNFSVANSQTIFIRIENKNNTNCYDTNATLELFVDPLPNILNNPSTLQQCISASNNSPTVNLTNAESNISDTANLTFEYYVDAAATTRITEPTSYPVNVNTTETVFVRVISDQGCFEDIVQLNVNVAQVADNSYNDLQTPVCDDFLQADGTDGSNNNDTDNITTFVLDKQTIENGINAPNNTQILYFENIQDRANTLNPIDITEFRNNIDKNDVDDSNTGYIQFPIYYKIISTVNNDCAGLGQFNLQINQIPSISSKILSPIEQCDMGTIDGNQNNGRNSNINLTVKNTEAFQGTAQNTNEFTFFFFKSQVAAFSGDTSSADYIANPEQYTNDVPTDFKPGDIVSQTIYLRIINNATGCVNPHASFDIVINPAPAIPDVIAPLQVCDVGTNDGATRNGLAQNINVSIKDIELTGGVANPDFTITYHKTTADLQDLNSSGIDKFSYESDPDRVVINPTTAISEEILLVRIVNNTTGCVFDEGQITIIVNPEPTFVAPTNLAYCDDNLDGDDANGIIQSIDLDSKIPEVLGTTQNPNDFNVTFHKSKAEATSGDNPVASPYENTNATERFFVRIQNKQTFCVNDQATFEVIVNPLPDFEVTSPQILCLNDVPLNIAVENPRDVYTYVWKDPNGNTINTSSVDNIDIIAAGLYTVTATTTNGTLCERVETIQVNASNVATLEQSFITIIDEANNIGSQDNISITIDTINNNLGPGDYQFAIFNQDSETRTPIIGFQEEPIFENLEGGIYTIIVNDKNGCSPDTTLVVSVIQFPKFFTPNADGKNDTWVVKGANKEFYPNSSINIFNRYGKLVAQVPIDSNGWNGMYQGKLLPDDDYWFNITLIPNENANKPIINKKGNFSLLR